MAHKEWYGGGICEATEDKNSSIFLTSQNASVFISKGMQAVKFYVNKIF